MSLQCYYYIIKQWPGCNLVSYIVYYRNSGPDYFLGNINYNVHL